MLNSHRYSYWIEVDLDAIRHNFRHLRQLAPHSQALAVVKSEAYGHGLEAVALVANEEGAWGFAIASLEEGRRLRRVGLNKPILFLTPILAAQIEEALKLELRLPIMDFEFAQAVSQKAISLGKTAKVHLKVDTGMGRVSVGPQEILSFASALSRLPNLEIEGIYSHLAAADRLDQRYTQKQYQLFLETIQGLEELGIKIPYRHLAASSATILLPATHFDLVRLGIALYGQWPSPEVATLMAGRELNLYQLAQRQVDANPEAAKFATQQYLHSPRFSFLRPALTFKAVVSQVKTLPAGSCVSYGCTFTCHRTTTTALLPVGYADGVNRLLSNKGEALIRGYRAPIIGRVCMNLCMVDVTDIPGVRPGDEAVLLGRQGADYIGADELAQHLQTINYEVLTSLPPHIPRVYLGRRPNALAELEEK